MTGESLAFRSRHIRERTRASRKWNTRNQKANLTNSAHVQMRLLEKSRQTESCPRTPLPLESRRPTAEPQTPPTTRRGQPPKEHHTRESSQSIVAPCQHLDTQPSLPMDLWHMIENGPRAFPSQERADALGDSQACSLDVWGKRLTEGSHQPTMQPCTVTRGKNVTAATEIN